MEVVMNPEVSTLCGSQIFYIQNLFEGVYHHHNDSQVYRLSIRDITNHLEVSSVPSAVFEEL
jgi:hypothetical protein